MGNEIENLLLEIEKERARRGMTIDQFTEEIGVAKMTYCGWIYHRRTPGLENLIAALGKCGMKLAVVKEENGND